MHPVRILMPMGSSWQASELASSVHAYLFELVCVPLFPRKQQIILFKIFLGRALAVSIMLMRVEAPPYH